MSQVSYALRMRTYRELCLDSADWPRIRAAIQNNERVSGTLKIKNPLASVRDWAKIGYVEAGNNETDLKDANLKSMRDGLLDDIGQLLAQTSIVNVGAKEMSGEEWFVPQIAATKSKLRFRDYSAKLDAAVKAKSVKIVHVGVRWEVADCILKYTSGKKGKAKKSITRAIADI